MNRVNNFRLILKNIILDSVLCDAEHKAPFYAVVDVAGSRVF